MLLEMAIADAYGIAFEFCPNTPDRPNDLSRFYQHPTYTALKPGQYTDDTQRALANVYCMINDEQYDAAKYAGYYLGVLKNDPRDGYSRGYQTFLETTPDVEAFIRTIQRTKPSNGSLMGVAPLGYLKSSGEVRLAATIQAATTHIHETIPFAQAVALSAHFFINKIGPKTELANYLEDAVEWGMAESCGRYMGRDSEHHNLVQETQVTAKSTFYGMMRGLKAFDNLADIMKWAVDCGGDTDSLAATTVAVASCSDEFENNIPQALIDGLEDGEYGRQHLKIMDAVLKTSFAPKESQTLEG